MTAAKRGSGSTVDVRRRNRRTTRRPTAATSSTHARRRAQIWTLSSRWCRQSTTFRPTQTRWPRSGPAPCLSPTTQLSAAHAFGGRLFACSLRAQKFQKHVNKPATQSAADKLQRKKEATERKRAKVRTAPCNTCACYMYMYMWHVHAHACAHAHVGLCLPPPQTQLVSPAPRSWTRTVS